MYYIAQTVFTANDLTHYGVPGMRWGHKNAKSQNGTDSKAKRNQRLKTAAKVAGATALAGAAAYGAYKGSKYIKSAKGVHDYNKTKKAIKSSINNKNVSDYYNKKSALKNKDSLQSVRNYYFNKQGKQIKISTDTLKGIEKTKELGVAPGEYRYKKLYDSRNRRKMTNDYRKKLVNYMDKL